MLEFTCEEQQIWSLRLQMCYSYPDIAVLLLSCSLVVSAWEKVPGDSPKDRYVGGFVSLLQVIHLLQLQTGKGVTGIRSLSVGRSGSLCVLITFSHFIHQSVHQSPSTVSTQAIFRKCSNANLLLNSDEAVDVNVGSEPLEEWLKVSFFFSFLFNW